MDFEKLLPRRERTREDAKSIELVASDKGYQMETKAKNRHIEKFNDWEEAWQIFRRTASYFKSYPMEQLVKYHDTIFRYQQRYTLEAVLRYDKAYRKTVANLQEDFDMDGGDIFADKLEGYIKTRCYLCCETDHLAKNCPQKKKKLEDARCYICQKTSHLSNTCPQRVAQWKGKTKNKGQASVGEYQRGNVRNPSFRNSFRENQYSSSEFNANQYNQYYNDQTCWMYNAQNGRCSRQSCKFAHVCKKCGGRHPAFKCYANAQANAKPAAAF